jgi:hypothetical protein
MSELRIENGAEWDDGQIVVMLDGDASEDDIAEAARRLQFAGATIRDVRWAGGILPFDLAAPTKQFVRQLTKRARCAAHCGCA